jgi:hypothetical protein
MVGQLYFQWQNEFLCKTIYPMREVKLRDFLIYYMEVDVWAQYKARDLAALQGDVEAYKKAWELNAAAAYKTHSALKSYFLLKDARGDYVKFNPLDEAELTEINNLHALFIQSWPKDIRGERSFVDGVIANWKIHRDGLRDKVKSLKRRHENMDPQHVKYAEEGRQLESVETITLPMAEQEMGQLRAFLATYDRIEQSRLAWYKLQKNDPNFKTPEAEFVVKFPPDKQVTPADLANWKVEEYTKSLENKNQYELLEEIYQRFKKEPQRFPQWLQYMVVHFSGMRYASAHGSWADPKNLIIRLRKLDVEREIKTLDDAQVEKRCQQKLEQYGAGGGTDKPKLALATEKQWQAKAALNFPSLKASGPKTRRMGLIALQIEEANYEIQNLSTEEALQKLMALKNTFPKWAWKEIVRFTPLRVTEVADVEWEKLTPQEEQERNSQQYIDIRAVLDAWENFDPTAWRDEHGRTHELIVARAVCNETAEHCQHIRGHLPPGGLAPKPQWYLANEKEQKFPGSYYVKPTSEKDYKQGASVLWLRFVDNEPSQWQIAKSPATKQGVGLLPPEFIKRQAKEGAWVYKVGEVTTRSRTVIGADKKKIVENQWLRWIHEATVAEVAETADGMTVITYETALPGGDDAKSAVGTFKMPLSWHLDDGKEDQYNCSFVGYVPEGQVPVEHLKTMLDWNKILRKQIV